MRDLGREEVAAAAAAMRWGPVDVPGLKVRADHKIICIYIIIYNYIYVYWARADHEIICTCITKSFSVLNRLAV